MIWDKPFVEPDDNLSDEERALMQIPDAINNHSLVHQIIPQAVPGTSANLTPAAPSSPWPQPELMPYYNSKWSRPSYTDEPNPGPFRAYHGSAHDFEQFDPSRSIHYPINENGDETSGGYGGVFFTPDPKTAGSYALDKAETNNEPEGQQIYPVDLEGLSNAPIIDFEKMVGRPLDYRSRYVNRALDVARRSGNDFVIFRNMNDTGGKEDQIMAVQPAGKVKNSITGSTMYKKGGVPHRAEGGNLEEGNLKSVIPTIKQGENLTHQIAPQIIPSGGGGMSRGTFDEGPGKIDLLNTVIGHLDPREVATLYAKHGTDPSMRSYLSDMVNSMTDDLYGEPPVENSYDTRGQANSPRDYQSKAGGGNVTEMPKDTTDVTKNVPDTTMPPEDNSEPWWQTIGNLINPIHARTKEDDQNLLRFNRKIDPVRVLNNLGPDDPVRVSDYLRAASFGIPGEAGAAGSLDFLADKAGSAGDAMMGMTQNSGMIPWGKGPRMPGQKQGREKFAIGGNPSAFVERAASYGLRHEGFLNSGVAGRTDHIGLQVRNGSYVIPADVVSAAGQGNSLAGSKAFDSLLKQGPYGTTFGNARVASTRPMMPSMRMGNTMRMPNNMGMKPMGMGKPGGPPFNPGIFGKADGGEVKKPRELVAPKEGSWKGLSAGGVSHPGADHHIPILAAGGEYIVAPETVARIGNGDQQKGFRILDKLVLLTRKKHIETLRKLKPPKKK